MRHSTVHCENTKRYLGFQPNFTQSGQSLCHHIIYHILWVVEMGGSVKITGARVARELAQRSKDCLGTKQTENAKIETNRLEQP